MVVGSPVPRSARPTPTDAFRLARRTWLRGDRLDMSALASELGIGRVTLYRWFGSREQLLVEVVWSAADRLLRQVDEQVDEQAGSVGSERVVAVVGGFLEGVIASPAMRAWIDHEGEAVMRLLTRRQPGFQPRLTAAIAALLERERSRGQWELPAEVSEVAYVIVRLIESYTYLDLITGETPDAERAMPILRMLLR
ncbi:MAG TPA: QsdR family transcriptional regulator [Nocardioides sp.]|uniref:QsdR family transcriptional regulator n=1 Tax=Nocardioides sp. TaxID=35761 RepID=UPI002ED8792F